MPGNRGKIAARNQHPKTDTPNKNLKTMKKSISTLLLAAIAAFVGTASQADIYTWTNGASNLAWDAASTNWNDGSNNVVWADNNTATLGATGFGAIRVFGTQTIAGLAVKSAG